ncbi:MAG: ABC transporter substrate-binding protein [Bacillota bacterium]
MKKLLLLALLSALSFTLVGCGGGGDVEGSSDSNKIVLSYADWGDTEMNQALIDAFEEENPNVEVELRTDITGTGGEFTQNLLNAQAAGVLPDVFAIDNVPTGYSNNMLLDISEYWDADPDTEAIYPNIKETAVYGDGRYAVPSFQFMKGIYLNLTILEDLNIDVPDKDWTYDEFVDLGREIRQKGKNDIIYGIDPWYGDLDFASIWPTQDHEDVGYNTWDGEKFNFNSDMWIEAFEARNDLMDEDVVAGFTDEEMEELGDIWPWEAGQIGMRIDGSWNLWMIETMYEDYGQEVGFWPYPGGDAGQFPPTILDFQVVSSQTDHPEKAYELAKWMTFGKEGWMTRLDIMEEREEVMLDRFPVADHEEVWNRTTLYMNYVEGLQESVDLLEYSKPDVDKWLPGYKAFWEWVDVEENYWDDINDGLVSPDSFAPVWEEKINELVTEAIED